VLYKGVTCMKLKMMLSVLVCFSLLYSMDLEKGTPSTKRTYKSYTVKNLKKKVSSGNGKLQKLQKKLQSNNDVEAAADIFKDYVKSRPQFSKKDEALVEDMVNSLRDSDPTVYRDASKKLITAWLNSNSPTNSSDEEQICNSQELDTFMLQKLKNQQEVRLEHMRIDHENAMQKRRNAQKKFYVTTVVALLTTITSIIQAIFLAKKSP